MLSGPSFAQEVARGQPTALVAVALAAAMAVAAVLSMQGKSRADDRKEPVVRPALTVSVAQPQRASLPAETRRDALWLAAEDYRRAGDSAAAARSFDLYAGTWPLPSSSGCEARPDGLSITSSAAMSRMRDLTGAKPINSFSSSARTGST